MNGLVCHVEKNELEQKYELTKQQQKEQNFTNRLIYAEKKTLCMCIDMNKF